MSLEQALAANTAAVLENTIAVSKLITLMACSTTVPDAADTAARQSVTAADVRKHRDENQTTMADSKKALIDAAKEKAKVEQTETGDAPQVEYSQIQALVPKIATTAEGTEMVKALFARFGVKRGPELKAEQYAGFYADLVRIQAGEYDPRMAEV